MESKLVNSYHDIQVVISISSNRCTSRVSLEPANKEQGLTALGMSTSQSTEDPVRCLKV